jgi:hypothetical protein
VINPNQQPAKPETNDHSVEATMDNFRPILADRITGGDAEQQKKDAYDPQ